MYWKVHTEVWEPGSHFNLGLADVHTYIWAWLTYRNNERAGAGG